MGQLIRSLYLINKSAVSLCHIKSILLFYLAQFYQFLILYFKIELCRKKIPKKIISKSLWKTFLSFGFIRFV